MEVSREIHPEDLITALRESDPAIAAIYTQGSCYQFHLMLKKLYPRSSPMINDAGDHVVTHIGLDLYDINGRVPDRHAVQYRPMSNIQIEMASQWSFANHHMLSAGECQFCHEPVLVDAAQPVFQSYEHIKTVMTGDFGSIPELTTAPQPETKWNTAGAFSYVDISCGGCEGWLNLFWGDHCIALVNNVALANQMRAALPCKFQEKDHG